MKCSKRCRRSSRYLWQYDREYRKRERERQKAAYAKKFFGYDAAFTKKIQAAETASDSALSDASKSPVNQQSESADTMAQTGESVNRKFSLNTERCDYFRYFDQQIDDYVAGKFPRTDTFVLGKTPDIFQKVGLSALPLTMDQVHVDYALNGTKNADHLMGADLLKKLPSLLEKPVAIIESATHPNNSVMAIVKGEVNGKQVTAAVRVGGMGILNKETIDSNHVVSVQGRQNAVSKLLVQAMEKENAGKTGVYYINKTEAQDLCARAGLQLPGSAAQDGLIHSVFDAGSPVNRKKVLPRAVQTHAEKRRLASLEHLL